MNSLGLREGADLCLRGCFSAKILGASEPKESVSKGRSISSDCRHNFSATTKSSFFPNSQFTNHESIPSLQESFVQFIKGYQDYSDTAPVDQIRAREYFQLSLSNHVCLDYIGLGLFSQSQVKSQCGSGITDRYTSSSPPYPHSEFELFNRCFNSVSLKSQLLCGGEASELESAIKKRILDFVNITQNDYCMVFTANRSSAFRLVAESYPLQTSSKLLTVYDHKSEALDAMVEVAEKRGARVMGAEFKWPRLSINSATLRNMIMAKKRQRGLFVFPLQSRMTGANYSYQWMTMAQEQGWHVLLDACAMGPKGMASFGLSLFQPDFLIYSFYKVFGENPTGFGCLFVKKSILPMLEDSLGAGIVSIIPAKDLNHYPEDSSVKDWEPEDQIAQEGINTSSSIDAHEQEHNPTKTGKPCTKQEEIKMHNSLVQESQSKKSLVQEKHASIKDGNTNIECRCLDHVDSLGLMLINRRGRYLINWLVSALMKLQHPNKLDKFPLVMIYGPKVKFDRGPALAFNILDWKGEKVEPALVQKLADRTNISLGHGLLQNIWFPEKCEEEKKKRILESNNREKETARTGSRMVEQGITAVTVALNFLANFEDIYRLWVFVAQFLDADFVEKERWRYIALNRKTIEV